MEAIQQNSFSKPQSKVLTKNKPKPAGQGFISNCMTTMNGSNKMFTPRPETEISSTLLGRKRKTFNSIGEGSPLLLNKRQSLKVLQPIAGNQDGLIGRSPQNDQDIKNLKKNLVGNSNLDKKERKAVKEQKSKSSNKKSKSNSKTSGSIGIFVDPTNPSSSDDSSNETKKKTTTDNNDVYAMMTKDEAPESYWKEIAEERRTALAATLEENKNLHNELNNLKCDYDRLKKVADQAEYFAGIIEDLLGKKVDDGTDDESETKSTELANESRKRKRSDEDDDETGLQHKEAKLYSSDEEETVEDVDDEDEEENSLFGSYV
ncbi:uncharacterized protein [Antedon mediterranea]|uniref:uncharacterized protein n=1 Tax=Antedon mediterranea TaxID=105859 RepID=UPI003AF4B7C2